jgi:nucleotide-binding universal stress UspA family protein
MRRRVHMYEKILVPLDGSKRAEMIRPHVRELASRFQATVILIKVVEVNSARFVEEEFSGFWKKEFDEIVKEHKVYLDSVAAKLREKGIACKTLVAHGTVVEKIIEAANKDDVDLIAMTSHGYGGLTRIFYGSVAAGILNRADRPLFIVRSRWEE